MMKEYFQKVLNNIWDPDYYERVTEQRLWAAFRYYIKMTLWLTLVYTAFISILFLPTFVSTSRNIISGLSDSYPTDLKIHLFKGEASVNVPEPLIIPLSVRERDLIKDVSQAMGSPENLIVIDTRTNYDPEEFSNYRSIFVLKKNAVVAMGSNGTIQVSPIQTGEGNVTISGEQVRNFFGKIQSLILVMAPLGVMAIYVLGVLFFIFTIGYLLVVSILAWLLLLVAGRKVFFKQALGITLHACTLSLVVNFFVFILYPSLSINFPFLVTFTLLIVYLNLIRKNKKPIVVPTIPQNVSEDTVTKEEKNRQ